MIRTVALAVWLSLAAPASAETVVIHAGRLITDASRNASGPATITVTDGRIASISEGLTPPPAGARLVDLSQKTVLPGLIDTHAHLLGDPGGDFWKETVETEDRAALIGAKNAQLTARAGFTTVRELGSTASGGFALRDATAEGIVPGPRIVAAGMGLSIVGGHGDANGFNPKVTKALEAGNICTGAEQCAARVREAARAGADVIKFSATGGVLSQQARGLGQHFTDAEMKAIVDTAHSLGLKVAAHAHSARGIEAAARAGVDSIEHGTFADAKAIQAMKASGSAFVPTLMAYVGIREGLAANAFTPAVAAKVRMTLDEVGKAARAARAAGVPVVFGTDSGVYAHGRNAEELGEMVERIGMTPREALASATTGAAKLLGLENEIGRIAPGYSADIIAVAGDPQSDAAALRKVDYVMVRGREIE